MLLRILSLSLSSPPFFSSPPPPHRRNNSSYLSKHSFVASFASFASSSKYVVPLLSNADSISSRASAKSALTSRSSVARSSVEMTRRSERRGGVLPKRVVVVVVVVPPRRERRRRMRARNMVQFYSCVGKG